MQYITQSTFYDYSVFVVWRIVSDSNESKKRKRVIVDIRDLNKITVTDFYFMSLQTNITSVVIDYQFISIFDVVDFFHQWLVKLTNRHKLIVISHREQEQFNVAVMKFKNSSTYVQRKIDVIFRVYREFARTYVDDIVIFSCTLKEHIAHLHVIFQLLNSYDINLSLKKLFFDYSIVALLKQKINAFDFITVVDKLKIISKLNFFYILKELKTYLSFIDWLREFVVFYAQKIDALQRRKTFLLRQFFSIKNSVRKIYFRRIIVENSTTKKLKFYR